MKFLKIINPNSYTHTQKILALFAAALTIVSVVTLMFGYRIGHKQGVRSVYASVSDDTAESSVSSLQVASLKQQLDAVVQERDISLSNLDNLRERVEEAKTENLKLKQKNGILEKEMLKLKEEGVPLKILEVEINPLPDRTYEYGFDVAMIDKSGKAVMLYPRLILLNEMTEAKIDVKPQEVQGVSYVRGQFVMPKGFVPKQIKVEVATAGSDKPVEKLYSWSVGKTVAVAKDKHAKDRPIGSK